MEDVFDGKRVTIRKIRVKIKAIELEVEDDEVAHGMEDRLHQSVLLAIAQGRCDNPVGCALEALTTLGLHFERWCA